MTIVRSYCYPSKAIADQEMTTYILSLIRFTIKLTGSAIVALSGGSTPVKLYQEIIKNLDEKVLNQIIFLQVDERFVPPNHDRSNQKMISQILGDAYFIPMDVTAESLEVAVINTENLYKAILNDRNKSAPDICILGMGNDGHTASLFPNNPTYLSQLQKDYGLVTGMYVESEGESRLTLTSNIINQSKKVLYIKGIDKYKTLKMAMQSRDMNLFPIASVSNDMEIFMVLQSLDDIDRIGVIIPV